MLRLKPQGMRLRTRPKNRFNRFKDVVKDDTKLNVVRIKGDENRTK